MEDLFKDLNIDLPITLFPLTNNGNILPARQLLWKSIVFFFCCCPISLQNKNQFRIQMNSSSILVKLHRTISIHGLWVVSIEQRRGYRNQTIVKLWRTQTCFCWNPRKPIGTVSFSIRYATRPHRWAYGIDTNSTGASPADPFAPQQLPTLWKN